MKFYIIATLIAAFFCALVSTLSIPYKDMSDLEIVKILITNQTVTENEGDILYPKNYDTWYVGDCVNVTFKDVKPEEDVSIFFFNKSATLAGGPISSRVFQFVVPPSAVSGPNDTSLLLAVRRENHYLQTVDAVILNVLAAK